MQELEFKILAYIKGELDERERSQMEQWVASSDANRKIFNEIEKIYRSSELDTGNFNPDVDRAWNTVAQALDQSRSKWSTIYKIAAMLTLAIGLSFVVLKYQQPEQLIVKTGEDEIKKLELADGSVVWLNENSVFQYPEEITEHERLVSLTGQAYFDIAKNPEKPFRIIGEKTTVEVLGTSFNLISRADYSNLNVTSGRVAYGLTENEDVSLILEKGSQATFEKDRLVRNNSFNENASAWVTKDFVFKSSPLSQVVEVLSEHFDVKFKVDETIENCLITSSFEDKKLDEILETLEALANIKSQKRGKTIKLTGPGC